MKPITLCVFGRVLEGRQQLTIQVSSRRTGRKYAIGACFEDVDNGWLPLEMRNRRLVRFAWSQLRGFFRTQRGSEHPLAGVHIKGTVSI